MFGWPLLIMMVAVGYLAYLGSGKLFSSILTGLAVPLVTVTIFGAVMGRAEFEAMLARSPGIVFGCMLLVFLLLLAYHLFNRRI